MAIDPLDIAYIALGARRALAGSPHAGLGLAACEGELGFVQACICHAGLLDRHWHALADGFPGVWCYEVAEPFGEAFGRHCSQAAVRTWPSTCCARSSMTA